MSFFDKHVEGAKALKNELSEIHSLLGKVKTSAGGANASLSNALGGGGTSGGTMMPNSLGSFSGFGGMGGGPMMPTSQASFSTPPPGGQQGFQAGIGMQALPTGQGNMLNMGMMGMFGSGFSGAGGRLGGALAIMGGLGAAAGVMIRATGAALPDFEETIGRQTNLYQAALRSNTGMSGMSTNVFNALSGGITSRGSDALVAALLANQGMVYSEDENSTYMQTLRGVRNSAMYLNMDNAAAAIAIEGMTSGAGSMNMLTQLGIYTSDPRTGKAYTQGQIFEQIAQRLTAGRGTATAEETLESIRRGNLGETIRNLGLSTDQQEMFKQFMIARTSGGIMDVSDTGAMGALLGENLGADRENPQLTGMEINTEDVRAMKLVTNEYIAGMKDATITVKSLVEAMKYLPPAFMRLEGFFSTLQGSQTGKFVEEFVSAMPGAVSGLVALSAFAGLADFASGIAAAAGVETAAGAITPGSSIDVGNMGPGTPTFIPPVPGKVSDNGYFGPRVPTGGIGSSNHKGYDFPVDSGTSVKASAEGTVQTVSYGSSYGNFVIIAHSGDFTTLYAHLSSTSVSAGVEVKAGQVIGKSGNTGTSTGPHLHFEIRKSGVPQNPGTYLNIPNKTNSSMGASGATGGSVSLGTMDASTARSVSSYSGSSSGVSSLSSAGSPSSLGASFFAGGGSMGSTYLSGAPSAKTGDAYVANDGPVNVHAGEAILTAEQADDWRAMMRGSRRGGGNNVTINVQLANASDGEARRLATMVKQYLEEDSLLETMGRK